MHHFYLTSHQANFIVNDVSGGGYCGFLFTSKEHIVGSFVPVVQEKVLQEN